MPPPRSRSTSSVATKTRWTQGEGARSAVVGVRSGGGGTAARIRGTAAWGHGGDRVRSAAVAALALRATTWGPAGGRCLVTGGGAAAWGSHSRGVSEPRTESPVVVVSRSAGGSEPVVEEERQSVALWFGEPLLYVRGITRLLLGRLKGQRSLGPSWLRFSFSGACQNEFFCRYHQNTQEKLCIVPSVAGKPIGKHIYSVGLGIFLSVLM
jgi:hypothetical protein